MISTISGGRPYLRLEGGWRSDRGIILRRLDFGPRGSFSRISFGGEEAAAVLKPELLNWTATVATPPAELSDAINAVSRQLPRSIPIPALSLGRAEIEMMPAQNQFEILAPVKSGKLSDLFLSPQTPMPDFFDDVFLPLTNLASYLRVMSDPQQIRPSVKAIELTADRIEEFLLIYGHRMQQQLTHSSEQKHAG